MRQGEPLKYKPDGTLISRNAIKQKTEAPIAVSKKKSAKPDKNIRLNFLNVSIIALIFLGVIFLFFLWFIDSF